MGFLFTHKFPKLVRFVSKLAFFSCQDSPFLFTRFLPMQPHVASFIQMKPLKMSPPHKNKHNIHIKKQQTQQPTCLLPTPNDPFHGPCWEASRLPTLACWSSWSTSLSHEGTKRKDTPRCLFQCQCVFGLLKLVRIHIYYIYINCKLIRSYTVIHHAWRWTCKSENQNPATEHPKAS